MAAEETVVVIEDDVTLTASAGDDTSAGTSYVGKYGGVAHVKLTNGGTGPTVAAQVQLQTSTDNSNYYDFGGPLVGATGNSAVKSWGPIVVPMGTRWLRSVSGSNTGQNVTVRIEATKVDSINA